MALFEHFAKDLASVQSAEDEMVRCPLCLREFGREAIADLGQDGLSIEHIIPSALGGREVTLTCRRCNNFTASDVEAHFVRMVRAADWSIGDGSALKGKLPIGDEELAMKVCWSRGPGPVVINVPGGKPEVLRQYRDMLTQVSQGDELSFRVSLDYKEVNARRGLIRIAYLTLFQCFGYNYILRAAGDQVRALIRQGTTLDMEPFVLRAGDVRGDEAQPTLLVVEILMDGARPAFLVLIAVETAQISRFPILMPGPDLLDVPDVIPRLREVATRLSGGRISFSQ